MKKFCLFLALIAQGAYADPTLVINANVITVDATHPAAQAFAYENGRFIAVGTNAQILKLKEPDSQVIDLHGDDGHARIRRRASAPAGHLR